MHKIINYKNILKSIEEKPFKITHQLVCTYGSVHVCREIWLQKTTDRGLEPGSHYPSVLPLVSWTRLGV